MRRSTAWLSVIAGILWGIKPIYDSIFNGRQMNTGYTPIDPTDYMTFLLPLCCLGSLFVIYARYKKQARYAVFILAGSLILSSCFHYFEIYASGSDAPFGFIFLFTSMLCMIAGSAYLYLRLRKIQGTRMISRAAAILFLSNLLLIVISSLTEVISDEAATPIMFTLMVSIGWIWAAIGLAALKLSK